MNQDEIDDLLGELTGAPTTRRARRPPPVTAARPPRRPPPPPPDVPTLPPARDGWSLDADTDLQDFLTTGGYRTTARGQSATHNRLGYDHRNASDIGVHPSSPEGVRLVSYLRERGVPFQAFTHAVPGAATAPHVHIGTPSHRTGARYAVGTTLQGAGATAAEPGDAASLLDEVAGATRQPAAQDDVDSLLSELTVRAADDDDDDVIRTETVINQAGVRLDPRTHQPLAVGQAQNAGALPPLRTVDIHTPEGRAERDRARGMENASSAFRTVDVELPSGQTDWSQVSSRALVHQAMRQLAGERQIPAEFVEQWLQQHGANTHLQDADGRAVNPVDVIGTEHYDGERRTIRVGAELPAFKQMEAEYLSSRGTAQRVADWATDDARTAGEKFMDVAEPTVSGAAHALDIATRPVQAASTGFWATVRGKPPEEIANAIWTEFREGRTVPGAENWIAEQLRHSDRLKRINPNLPGMLGELANMVADPVNLLPVAPFTRLGARALRATRTGARIMEGFEGARDSFAASRLGGDGNILRIAEATDDVPVPESSATLAAQMDAMQAGRRPAVLVTSGEGMPEVPRGFTTTDTPAGTFIHDPRSPTSDEIAERVAGNTHGELLGHVEPRSERTTQAVVARDPQTGMELQASYVSPENVRAQAAEFQRQYPGARIEAGGAETEARVLQERTGGAEASPPQPAAPYGSQNRLVTTERAEAARARLKARLSTNRVNDITELGGSLGDVLELATFHVEAGARTFAEFSARMIDDIGEDARPYLRDLYERAHSELGTEPEQVTENARRKATRGEIFLDVVNTPRSLMSSADLSAPGRQGLIQSVAHPVLATRAGADMFRSLVPREYDRIVRRMSNHPSAKLAEESGLYLASREAPRGKHSPLGEREEAFISRLVGRIPVVGHVTRASERTYTAYLDRLRIEVFDRYARDLKRAGASPADFKAAARFVNITTGRGDYGRLGAALAPVLSTAMFSPRLLKSRFQFLNPLTYARMPRAARRLAMRDAVKFAGTVTATLMLARAAGAEVSLDPEAADFGKIKVGNTRYDVLGGAQQPVRFLYRMSRGFYNNMTGKKNERFQEPVDVATQFFRSKLAPVPSYVWDAGAGRDFKGERFAPASGALERLAPMIAGDAMDAYRLEGAAGLWKTIPSFFGIGSSTYEKKQRRKGSKLPHE
jgi:hypothetical protein